MYYRHKVEGGEFVLRCEGAWRVTFNGVQIGGIYPTPQDAVHAVTRRRQGLIPGPDLTGVSHPPADLSSWETPLGIVERVTA
jgi:hypothetical protein